MKSIEASKKNAHQTNLMQPTQESHSSTETPRTYMSYMSHHKTFESLTRNEAVNPKTILSCGITAAQQSVQGG